MRKESPKSAILEFGEAHVADFPVGCDMNTFKAEVDAWIDLFADQLAEDLPSTAAAAFRIANNNPLLPTTSCLLCLICTWPVTSAECEHSISGLKRVETPLRTMMGQSHLNGLAMIHVHYSTSIQYFEKVGF